MEMIVLWVTCSTVFSQSPSDSAARQAPTASWMDSLQTWADYVLQHVEKMAPEELRRQKQARVRFQQDGYTNILLEVMNQDGLGALISYAKVKLNIEYSMPHKTLWIIAPQLGIPGVPFPDDWGFPVDPWKREWWYKE